MNIVAVLVPPLAPWPTFFTISKIWNVPSLRTLFPSSLTNQSTSTKSPTLTSSSSAKTVSTAIYARLEICVSSKLIFCSYKSENLSPLSPISDQIISESTVAFLANQAIFGFELPFCELALTDVEYPYCRPSILSFSESVVLISCQISSAIC